MAQIEPISRLTASLAKLPGVGQKTAQRLSYHILSMSEQDVRELSKAYWKLR
jgi:recombination protein RecR